MQFLALLSLFFSLGGISSAAVTQQRRSTSSGLLFSPPGFAPLPKPNVSRPRPLVNGGTPGLNLSNIQGDILVGMTKLTEVFFFFGISSPADFKTRLASNVFPLITSTLQILESPPSSVNVAFSNSGLNTLGITNLTSSTDPFTSGQASNAATLGDPTPIQNNWEPVFVDTSSLHGVFVVAADDIATVNATLAQVTSALGDSIVELYTLQAQARPGTEQGHEHFGFLDGVSQPGIEGFTTNPVNGQVVIPAGIILVGEDGDTLDHPDWAKDGSFLAFRQYEQLVPEFDKFLLDNAVFGPGVTTAEEGAELLGARMMGRWKSGTPVELSPFQDNLTISQNPNLINDFDFTLAADNSLCPFAAHIRKTNPRSDLDTTTVDDPHRIMRAGTPYGPEITAEESASNTTMFQRGLAFVAYQSNIAAGFQFLQHTWANNPGFLPHTNFPMPGFDGIIGANGGQSRFTQGLDPANQTRDITLPFDFIVSRGGEYFFSPSLSAIIGTIAA